jgi:cell division protein FtsL
MTLVTIKIHSRHFAIYSTTIYKQKLVAHGQIEKYIGTYTTQLVFAIYHILVQTKIMERERKAQEAYTNISKPLLTPLSPLQVTV